VPRGRRYDESYDESERTSAREPPRNGAALRIVDERLLSSILSW
jgi:hypothetical protein